MGRRLGRASARVSAAQLRLHRTPLVRAALALVRAAGHDVFPILARYQLSPQILVERECLVPLGRYRELMRECAALAKIANLGAHLAASLPRGYLGVFELSAASAPTLWEAARRFVRYLPLMSPLLQARLDETADFVTLRQWIDGEPQAQGAEANEFVPAALVRHIRELVGGDVEISEVLLAHAEPADSSGLRAFFGGATLTFGTGYNGVAVRREIMARPQLAANDTLMRALDEHARWLLARPGEPPAEVAAPAEAAAGAATCGGFLEAVRHAIVANLTHSEALLPRVAEVMGMTPRTMQRRLREAGWSFRPLVDQLRREVAAQLERGGQRTAGEVAYLLGYTELSSFHRANRRWKPS